MPYSTPSIDEVIESFALGMMQNGIDVRHIILSKEGFYKYSYDQIHKTSDNLSLENSYSPITNGDTRNFCSGPIKISGES
jgi:hypothetical protein